MPALPPCPVPRYFPFQFEAGGNHTSNPISFSMTPSTPQNGLVTVVGTLPPPRHVQAGAGLMDATEVMCVRGRRSAFSMSHDSAAATGKTMATQQNTVTA